MKRTAWVQLVVFVLGASSQSSAGDSMLLFGAEEIRHAYQYQQHAGARLQRPLAVQACLYGKVEFTASYQGREFPVACRFITETMRHLKQSIESGAVKYLFPLDTGHALLGLPIEIWEQKYRNSTLEEMLHGFLKEPDLVALYQAGQYVDSESSAKTPGAGKTAQHLGIL